MEAPTKDPEAVEPSKLASPVNASEAPTTSTAPAPEETTAVTTESTSKEVEALDDPSVDKSLDDPMGNENLNSFVASLKEIILDADHGEMWGVTLNESHHIPTRVVLQKFLNANNGDLKAAQKQLGDALRWRKKMDPLKLMKEVFDADKFGGLGYVTEYKIDSKEDVYVKTEIISWNIYGAVKNIKATFGNVEEFVRWRTALMELSLLPLDLPNAKFPVPQNPAEDPYKIIQVHDYLSVSFLRMDPQIRAASKEIIQVFGMAYPELLKEKFFVNVPLIMGWVFGVVKMFVSKETVKKFHPLSYGGSLAQEVGDLGPMLPKKYGGKGKELEEVGLSVASMKMGEPRVD